MAWFKKPKYATLPSPKLRGRIPEGMFVKCDECLELFTNKVWEENERVCPKCDHHQRLSARQRIELLLDDDSFEEFDVRLTSSDPLNFKDRKTYPERVKAEQAKSGELDSVVSGLGTIEGRPLSIAVMDFGFIAGSMGSVAGEKITRAIERGLERRLPVLVVVATSGARMMEGVYSLMQLTKTSAAIGRLGQAGLPFFVLLTNPSLAGIMASFGSLGDVIVAEPRAMIGFAGQRVIEQTIKQILPPGFQRSEFVHEHGFVDIVARREELRPLFARLIDLLGPGLARLEHHEAGEPAYAHAGGNGLH